VTYAPRGQGDVHVPGLRQRHPADGNYRVTLPAGSAIDVAGNVLVSDYAFDFYVLGGDANRDRKVDIQDLLIMATHWQGNSKVFSQGDFNTTHGRRRRPRDSGVALAEDPRRTRSGGAGDDHASVKAYAGARRKSD